MVYSINDIRNMVAPIIRKYHIPAMYLFGSYARGDATDESDIDFLIDTTGTQLTSLLKLGALYCELEELFQKRIDIVTIRAISQKTDIPSDLDFKKAVLMHSAAANGRWCGDQRPLCGVSGQDISKAFRRQW